VEYEKKLEAELKELWALRDNLQKSVSNNGLREMLEYGSGCSAFADVSRQAEQAAQHRRRTEAAGALCRGNAIRMWGLPAPDLRAFVQGALPMCPDCKQGHLYYSAGASR
jgi:hypothetical protein